MSNPNQKQHQQQQSKPQQQSQQPKATDIQLEDNQQATQQPNQQADSVENKEATQQPTQQPQATRQQVDTTTQATEQPKAVPVIAAPVPVPSRQGVQTPSAKLPVGHGELNVEELVARARAEGDINAVNLAERLDEVARQLSRRTASTPDQAAKFLEGLYGTLLNVLNIDKSRNEFNTQWEIVLKKFKQHSADGLGGHRLYRGVGHWGKGQDAYVHLQALVNLIMTANREKRESLYRTVNFNALIKPGTGLTAAGASRLMAYYN